MKKLFLVALAVVVFASMALAQTGGGNYTAPNANNQPAAGKTGNTNPAFNYGVGIQGIDKLGAHQNGGRGCVGCHAPHSGARGNGGSAGSGGANYLTDTETGNAALWGQDLSPLYSQTLNFGDNGDYDIAFGANFGATEEGVVTGVMMCLSCHDGNIAKGAMMTNQSYEQATGLLPTGYGKSPIPTLLGNDGTTAGNYHNDHPIGPKANMGAVGVASRLQIGQCPAEGGGLENCVLPNSDAQYTSFIKNYGSFNVTRAITDKDTSGNYVYPTYVSGGRANPLVVDQASGAIPDTAYVVCTTCHTPHSMYTFKGVIGVNGASSTSSKLVPTYFFIAAPYNPAAPVNDGTKASSATQFCRQCHFTGAGGANEGSGINGIYTQY